MLVIIAGASDLLDGWLAKRYDWRSELGGMLDPIADKLLLNAGAFGLWWSGHLPDPFFWVLLARDVIIVSGATVWQRLHGRFHAEPSGLGKATTLMQIVYLGLVLGGLAFAWPAMSWMKALMAVVIALMVASGLDYMLRFGWRAWRLQRDSHKERT